MANGNEEQVQKSKKAPHTTQVEKAKPKSNSSVSKNNYLITALAFIVALGALGIAAYTFSLNKQLHDQLNAAQNNITTQLQQLEQKQEQTQEQINTKTNNAEEIQTQLQTKYETLSKQLQTAMSQRFYQNQDWVLLKARYYLELAQINAHWSNGVDATIALLEQADQLLKQLNNPKIFNIRQAIAKDIAQMHAVPSVDVAGLLSQLDAAQNSINDLSIPLPVTEKPATENATPSPNNSSWRSRLQSSMNVLEKLVVIRRHDQDIKPLMSPLFEAILKEKLRLNLQEAQWAVLHHNAFVYQLVLKQAINNLSMNFNKDTPTTAALIKKLTDLRQVNITPKRPELGSALPMLNELIDAKSTPENQSSNEENSTGGNQ